MSAFTMYLKDAIHYTEGVITYENGIAVMTGGNIGLNSYEIWKEEYRVRLNGKIIDHYFNREIGFETIDLFQQFMRRTMNEVMPLYNQMYLSTEIAFDPMKTIDMRTMSNSDTASTAESTSETTGNSTSASTSETEAVQGSRAIDSNFPQQMLSADNDYGTSGADVEGSSSATAAGNQTANSTGNEEAESNVNSTTNQESTVSGYQGLPSDMLMRYRESMLNIDLMVIRELEDCFMQIFDNGDTYFNNERRYY